MVLPEDPFIKRRGRDVEHERTANEWLMTPFRLAPNTIKPLILMHADGAQNSTTFVNSIAGGPVMEPINGAYIDTSTPRFGTGAARLGGAALCLRTTTPITLSGPFTICAWLKSTFIVGWLFFLGKDHIAGGISIDTYTSDVSVKTTVVDAGSETRLFDNSGAIDASNNAQTMWALTRDAQNVIRLFIGGNSVGTPFTDATAFSGLFTWGSSLNQYGDAESGREGFHDELLVFPGACLYTENYTPPTSPFTYT